MKRFIIIMAAIVCLASAAWAQNNRQLSPEQWKHAVAVCAQATAYDQGFGKDPAKLNMDYPQGYTLDDLNTVYRDNGPRWRRIYDQFKKDENRNGDMEQLRGLIKKSNVWNNLVEPELNKYLENQPVAAPAEDMADGQPAPDGQQPNAQPGDPNGAPGQQVAQGPDGKPGPGDRHHRHDGKPGEHHACNWPLWLGILGSLLGLIALIISLINSSRINKQRRFIGRELDRTNGNLQQLANESAEQMKALSIRLTGKEVNRNRPTGETAVADNRKNDQRRAQQQPQQQRQQQGQQGQQRQQQGQQGQQRQQQGQQGQQRQQQGQQQRDNAGDKREAHKLAQPLTVFLSKPDDNDNFVRATDTFEPGNSIYRLTTDDGEHGKFEVIDNPDVHRFALMMPAENLMRACSGNAIQIPSGTRIVTDRPGEAIFKDGKWHVSLKAIIHYA